MKNILKFLYCFPPHLSQDSTKDLHLLGGHPYCGGSSPGRVTKQWQPDTQAQANLRRQDQRRSSAGHATVKDVEIPTEKTIVNDVRETLAHTKAGKSKEGEAPPPSFYPGWDPVSVFFLLCKMGGCLWLFPLKPWLRPSMPRVRKRTMGGGETTNRVIRRAPFGMTRASKQFFSTPTTKPHCIFIDIGQQYTGF